MLVFVCNDLIQHITHPSHGFLIFYSEYYTVQNMSQDVVNPDGVPPSVVLLITLNLKVF